MGGAGAPPLLRHLFRCFFALLFIELEAEMKLKCQVMHLLTYFFSVHLMLWLCYTLRSLNGGLLDTVRTVLQDATA